MVTYILTISQSLNGLMTTAHTPYGLLQHEKITKLTYYRYTNADLKTSHLKSLFTNIQ